ncbi:MAG: DUF6382 domain-containing protein [Lachnotalea sp.]
MNREYKRDLNNNYMILNNSNSEIIDDYKVRMLISNKIPFIMKCNMRKFDGIIKYYYEITSKQPMNRTFEKKKIGMNELNNIITSFLKVLDSSVEYLLNPNDFILNPEYIYMNIETNQIYFCYMPGYEVDMSKNFNELTSYILDKIDHNDKHAVATAYELYRQTLNENYSLKEILNSIKRDNEEIPAESLDEFTREDKNVSEYNPIETRNEPRENIKKNQNIFKPLYIVSGIVSAAVIAFLIYYLLFHIELIKNIRIDNDVALKLAGAFLIIGVVIIYILIQKRKERSEEEADIIVVTQAQEDLPFSYKVTDTKYEHSNKIMQNENKINNENKISNNIKINNTKKESYSNDVANPKELLNTNNADNQNDINYSKTSPELPKVYNISKNTSVSNQIETYGNTVLLAYKSTNKKLISSKDQYDNMELVEKSFLIGKMAEHVDGIIQDERVSRIHAEIKNDNGIYFLTDLNSTNGTFHNNRRLESNETVEIKTEDLIRFATLEYVFR